jgi:hypothetical protein
MGDARTRAGRQLLAEHPELSAAAVNEVEDQAHGRGIATASERMDRVLDRLRPLLTTDQLGAVMAVRALDPDAIASLDDEALRIVLAGFSDPRLTPAPDPAAREAGERYHNEIR